MSVDGGENPHASAFSNSSQRVPPPPFSASSLASNQRKRPVLSGLGSESAGQSEFTSPNTPTPYEAKTEISALHVRTTPSEPMSSFAAGTPIYHHVSHQSNPPPSTKEPHLASIHALLNEFQLHYDMKKQRISALESQIHAIEGRLQQREIELQTATNERVSAFKQLDSQRHILDELQAKLQDFSKYESLISSRFSSFESLMSDLSNTKASYIEKELELTKSLEEKAVHLEDSLRMISELRQEKGRLETKNTELEDDMKQQCTEFNQRLHALSEELKEKSGKFDALYQEREILKADLKNIGFDRDRFQREVALALKEISSFAISDAFSAECNEDSLRSLASAINWIKSLCTKLHDQNNNSRNLLETIKADQTSQLNNCQDEIARLKTELDDYSSKCTLLQAEVERLSEAVPKEDYLKAIEELGFSGPNWKSDLQTVVETRHVLEEKYNKLRHDHEKEISSIKDHYAKILREETAALKAKLDKSEAEVARLKSNSQPKSEMPKENPDLTTLLGLKAFGKSIPEKETIKSTNTRKRTKITSAHAVGPTTTNPKRALRSSTKILSSPSKSQDSVLSSDIWTIFN